MFNLPKVGRLFYGLGIIAYGLQQIIILDFRQQILPNFPSWAHTNIFLPVFTGLAMIAAGLMVSGVIIVDNDLRKKIALYMGFYFFALIILSHVPYLLFVYPHKLSHLGSWGDLLKELAFSGASLIIANSFLDIPSNEQQKNRIDRLVKNMSSIGRIFYCTTIILFGCNHFAYDLSFMVPKWFVFQNFWSYFGGAALIPAGAAIAFKVLLKPVSILLALMLFLWFILLHVPGAIRNPYVGRGNLIVSAFDALLFCGTALVLSGFQRSNMKSKEQMSVTNLNQLH